MAASVAPPTAEGNGTYTYSSQPRAVQQRPKFRAPTQYSNIMYDKRIVRGNTYALHTLPASSQPDPLELQRQQESRRRALARKRARDQLKPMSPEPVEGRKHIDVQTELYLEEITDRVEEADVQTQTDAFLDRPPTPLFVPAKTGLDVATQIEEGDLFDFNLEVKPILEVLVGKTVEQALLEVMEEEELASLRSQQRQFEENRNAEVVETQRLEEQERRRREEKERRMQQQREALLKEKETAEKIAARAFAQSYLSDLVPSVFNTLSEHGFFYDPVEREVETVFMPWLMDETIKAQDKAILARVIVDVIIRDVVAKSLGIPTPEYFAAATPAPATPEPEATASNEGETAPERGEALEKVFGKQDKPASEQPKLSTTDPSVEPIDKPSGTQDSTSDPPADQDPASDPTPATQDPTSDPAQATQDPTSDPAQATQDPTSDPKPTDTDPTVSDPTPADQDPTSNPAPVNQDLTSDPPADQGPASDPTPATHDPTSDITPTDKDPAVSDPTPADQDPTSDPAPVNQDPTSDPAADMTEPAKPVTDSEPTPEGSEALAQSEPPTVATSEPATSTPVTDDGATTEPPVAQQEDTPN